MRNMSFALTMPQLLDGSKTVTRRLGWRFLKRGDLVCAVKQSMGLRKRQKIKRLAVLRILDVRRERLDDVTLDDVQFEGFPGQSRQWFVEMFCREMGCKPWDEVTRIQFRFLYRWKE